MSNTKVMDLAIGQVHILNSTTFKPFIESMGMIARIMRNSEIQFAQLDALGNGDVSAPFKILSYPHVMLFQGLDNVATYHGAFREADIVTYLNRLSFPTVSAISETSFEDFKSSNDVVVVGYLAPDDNDSHETFSTLAEAMRADYLFGITNDSALAKAEQVDMPGIAVYKSFDEGKEVLNLSHDIDQVSASLRAAARPLIMDFVSELHEDYIIIGPPLGYLFADTTEERARLHKIAEPLAKKYQHKIQFGIADPNTFDGIFEDLHLRIEHLPAFAIREPVKNLRFPLNEPRAPLENELEAFVQDLLNGKLEPTIKSEPIPEKSQSPLVHVVALNYQDIVMNEEKDVLLEFCIEPCNPCKMLLPTLEQLARLYASDTKLKSQVTIGTINVDANDIPDRGIQGFPTLKLYSAGSKDAPVFYYGTRTLRDIAEFIRDHGKHRAKIPGLEEEQILEDEDSKEGAATSGLSEGSEQVGSFKTSSIAQAKTIPSGHDEL